MKKLTRIPLTKSYKLVNHGPVVIITTFDGKKHNAAPIAWLMPLDFDPPRFAAVISSGHKTFKNLMKTKECVINIPTSGQVGLVSRLGSVSGHKVDKMKGIPSFPARKVKAMKIEGCVAWIEAKLEKIISPKWDLLLLKGVDTSATPGAVDGKYEYLLKKYQTIHHLGGKSFGACQRVRS